MKYFGFLLLSFLILGFRTVKAQKKLVIIGSSTSTCAFGLNSVTECYVYKLGRYYDQQAPQDTIVDNSLTLGGTNCYNGMPSSYTPPYPDAAYQPNPARNITAALASNPDVILVNYPTNAYDVLSVTEIMYCLRTIRDSANIKGVPCFITTTQPRTSPASFNTSPVKAKLAELKDSILLEFGNFAVDFWTGLINTADTSILYDSGDNIHMNAAGHDILYQRVLAKNVFLATLPATFLQFNALHQNKGTIITWLAGQESNLAYYEIQRSIDGTGFSAIGTVNANNAAGPSKYQYMDGNPPNGNAYYKIVIVDKDGKKHASPVMSVFTNTNKLAIVKTFARSASQVVIELQNNEAQNVQLEILNSMGALISRETRKIEPGSNSLYISTSLLSNGVYHVRINGAHASLASSFIKN